MPELKIQIPENLGLSEEQIKRLEEGFQNQIANILKDSQAKATAIARPQIMFQHEISTVGKAIQV